MLEENRPQHSSNEMSLIELIQTLWHERLLLVASMFITLSIGLGYLFFAEKVFKAEVTFLPPPTRDIAELNKLPNKLTSIEVYKQFQQTLESSELRKIFYNNKSIKEHFNPESLSISDVWERFNKAINIKVHESSNLITLEVAASTPEKAADFANTLAHMALDLSKNSIISDFNEELHQLKANNEYAIKNSTDSYQLLIENEINKLTEAKHIAERINLEKPQNYEFAPGENNDLMIDEVRRLYSLGSIALAAEIEAMKKRKQENSLIPGLDKLKLEKNYLNSIKINTNKVKTAVIDLEALTPTRPASPKKELIFIISPIIGIIIGLFYILFRKATVARHNTL